MADKELLQRDLDKFENDKEYIRKLGELTLASSLNSFSKRQSLSAASERSNTMLNAVEKDSASAAHHFQSQQPPQHQRSLSQSERNSDNTLTKSSSNKSCKDIHEHSVSSLSLRKQESFNEKHRNSVIESTDPSSGYFKLEDAANIVSGAETMKRHYQSTIRKYDNLKIEYESLHKRYADLVSAHSSAVSKLELAQEELVRFRLSYDEVINERNAARRECTGLKQQCTAAIRQWDKALRECNEAKEQLAKVQQQRDEAMKEINQAMTSRIKATKDLARLTEERNAAVHEYSLVMSERDTVHKEIEKLQEELTESQKKIKVLEEEKKIAFDENENLKREITALLVEKERLLKEGNYLREKYGDFVSTGNDEPTSPTSPLRSSAVSHNRWGSSSSGVSSSWAHAMSKSNASDLMKQNHLSVSNSSSMSTLSHHKVSITNLDQANLEIESLRRHVKQLQQELEAAHQEVEVCKRRHDWAFSERDKIVLERESIRALCDKYRRERDRAVSDLAEALMDSDDIKRQRNEASKELKDLKDKFESHFGKEATRSNHQTQSLSRSAGKKVKEVLSNNSSSLFSSLSPSHESTQSTPAPTLLDRAYNEIFGERNHQNKQKPVESELENQNTIKSGKAVTNLQVYHPTSKAADSLDYSVVSAQSRDKNVFDYYKNRASKRVVGHMTSDRGSPMPLSYTVEWLSPPHGNVDPRDRKANAGDVRSIYIEKSSEPLGIQISCDTSGAGGIFVSSVSENSIAAQTGLQVGDQLLEVCGINMRNATYTLAANVLRQCGDSIRMLVQYNPDKFKGQVCDTSSEEEDQEILPYNTVVYKSRSLLLDFSSSFYGLRLSRKGNQTEPMFNAQNGEF
ncbi:Disks large-like protein [Dinothrombium tinctorium]|uniref:Disks large-like protein n=1 Tax=Dinothrombium tinctorium TaxID=1965070 RepID=A0A3S4QHI3_9ACAR|nr:Disks large-like protein [Dinothrombium tinctorium]RWS04103.1 Disks large-like protein [Dinothrombium tinctorium]RWS04281.1 Disks large-like protein [Dinothrombium tinctorium]